MDPSDPQTAEDNTTLKALQRHLQHLHVDKILIGKKKVASTMKYRDTVSFTNTATPAYHLFTQITTSLDLACIRLHH